uniref:Uncharacterized protein n=1 Tax=Tanacetum cinerariifolium TaxID=118510 RepID=A0A6L2L2C1_TANCI|nr:hypothetical protein [Tanacetum cinerariifolium]
MSSNEASSRVTYTSISSDYEEPPDVRSPRIVVYGYDGLPMHPVDPPSPDYVPSPKEPEQAPLSSDYMPGPEYPEYLALYDEEVPIKDQPYAVADSPIALSSGYLVESDPKENSKDESEDGPMDCPADGEMVMMMMMMTPLMMTRRRRRSTWLRLTLSLHPLLTMSPLLRRQSCLRPMSLRLHHHHHLQAVFAYTCTSITTITASTISLYLPPPVPTSLPLPSPPLPLLPASLFIPPPVDRKEDILEAELPTHKRLCLTALTSRYKVGESSIAVRPIGDHRTDYGFIGTLDADTKRQRVEEVGYDIRDVWVDPTEAVEEIVL